MKLKVVWNITEKVSNDQASQNTIKWLRFKEVNSNISYKLIHAQMNSLSNE